MNMYYLLKMPLLMVFTKNGNNSYLKYTVSQYLLLVHNDVLHICMYTFEKVISFFGW